MQIFKSKYGKLSGSDYDEVIKLARQEYHIAQKLTPRRVAYVRSTFFKKDKIFLNTFGAT